MSSMSHNESFWIHLEELRKRLFIIIFVLCFSSVIIYFFHDLLLTILIKPVDKLIFISPLEVFLTRIKVSLFGGLFLSLPVILYNLWKFVIPACYEHEKKHFVFLILISFILFVCGVLFAFYIVFPLVLDFLLGMGTESLVPFITFDKYISFTIKFLIAFGLMFELPVILFYLVITNIISLNYLREKRKHAIIVIMIISAILTPPDIFSQIMISVPTYLLFEISLLFAGYLKKEKTKK